MSNETAVKCIASLCHQQNEVCSCKYDFSTRQDRHSLIEYNTNNRHFYEYKQSTKQLLHNKWQIQEITYKFDNVKVRKHAKARKKNNEKQKHEN